MVNLNQDATKRFSSETWRESFQPQTRKARPSGQAFAYVIVNNYRTFLEDIERMYLLGIQATNT